MAQSSTVTDVRIVGGSHAGLSAGLTLYRGLHTIVVFDDHSPRNHYSSAVHLVPTWDNENTESLREASKSELLNSGLCHFVDSIVEEVERLAGGIFSATDRTGTL